MTKNNFREMSASPRLKARACFGERKKQYFKLVRKTGREPYKRPPGLSAIQRRTGNPRPTKSRPRVKRSGFNFARGPESPFVHYTQPCGFVCQRQKPLGYIYSGAESCKAGEVSRAGTASYQSNCEGIFAYDRHDRKETFYEKSQEK